MWQHAASLVVATLISTFASDLPSHSKTIVVLSNAKDSH